MFRALPSLRFVIPVVLLIALWFVGSYLFTQWQLRRIEDAPLMRSQVMFIALPQDMTAIVANKTVYVYRKQDVQARSFAAGEEPAIRPGARAIMVDQLLERAPIVLTDAQFEPNAELRTAPAPQPMTGEYGIVNVRLTDEGRQRLWKFSAKNVGRTLVIAVGDRYVARVQIETPLNVTEFEIQPIWHVESARLLQQALNAPRAPR
ncbi:MAG: hypothetical protein ACUVTY_01705 [Armatimonadota bacterium]